jgi:hypothetical protein
MSPGYLTTYDSQPVADTSHGYFSILDTGNLMEVELYERAFYSVFVKVTSNRLVRKIWDWDEESHRLKTKIPYEDQVVFSCRNAQGEIKSAVAFSLNTAESQFGNFGFQVPAGKKGRYVELLTLFTQPRVRLDGFRFTQSFFRPHCVAYMQNMGYDFGLTTCAERPLATYLRWGWEVLEEAVIDHQKRYFLYYDIHKNLPQL